MAVLILLLVIYIAMYWCVIRLELVPVWQLHILDITMLDQAIISVSTQVSTLPREREWAIG